uniref:S-protein homolog n=1 Tax=Solanum lycopersicum TaxID=4081 RepID=A0A3Q7I6R9_SOLLC
MTTSYSSHHHFVLCLFLVSFLCVNSQNSYVVILRNESPNNVATDQCYVNDEIDPAEKVVLNPGMSDHITTTFFPGNFNTLSCNLQLEEKHANLFTLFDSNDTSICHNPSEECLWKMQEDGLCMCSQVTN